MKNKLFGTLTILALAASTFATTELKLENSGIRAVVLKNANTKPSFRSDLFGVAIPVTSTDKLLSLDLWGLLNTQKLDRPYLGAGVSVNLANFNSWSVGVTGGWATSLNFKGKTVDEGWRYGLNITKKF